MCAVSSVNTSRTIGCPDPYLTVRWIGRVIVGETNRLDRMPSFKRLVSVVAVALFVLLGSLSNAAADPSAQPPDNGTAPTATGAPGGPSAGAGEQPPLPAPGPPPVRHNDPPPDGGPPLWLWILFGLAAASGVWVAVLWVRGSRMPANAEPLLESTAELVAVGRQQSPLVTTIPGIKKAPPVPGTKNPPNPGTKKPNAGTKKAPPNGGRRKS